MISGNLQKKMPRSGGRSAGRKPLLELTNGGDRPAPEEKKTSFAVTRACCDGGGDLDLLLLARSDLSNLVVQVDELVALALDQGEISRSKSLAIESFTLALRDMRSSLQAWIPRLKQEFSRNSKIKEKPEKSMDSSHSEINKDPPKALHTSHVPSELKVQKTVVLDKNNNKHTSVVSPSPQESKEAIDSSLVPSEPKVRKTAVLDENDNEHSLVVSPSPLVSWRGNNCMVDCGRQLFLLTPLPKPRLRSPWRHTRPRAKKSTAEAKFEFPTLCAFNVESQSKTQLRSPLVISNIKNGKRRSTLVLTSGAQISDDPSSDEAAENLASRYQELLGFQTAEEISIRRQEDPVDSLDWFLSPPKTCVLMEPIDNKPDIYTPNTIRLSTPMVKAFQSNTVNRAGKQPGETTLKRELWTKFDAVSSTELKLNTTAFQRTAQKAFLEMLEEASCESTSLEI